MRFFYAFVLDLQANHAKFSKKGKIHFMTANNKQAVNTLFDKNTFNNKKEQERQALHSTNGKWLMTCVAVWMGGTLKAMF
ncbi:hypothetical protein AGMMS49921_04030 [Endomicrobiia bacterium]|nr:hypothetical protein AGMMS49921_04030 [Endomicrobiia bacterium]